MKFSELWLHEWINVDLDSEVLLNQITMAGLEVNSVESVAGSFSGVIIGEIVECKYQRHPDVSNLCIMKVDIGSKQLINVACGVPNCKQGLKVAVATAGAVLPDNLKIKTKKIYDELSEGMLCSFSELGICGNYNNIIELPNDAPVGTDIREYLRLDDKIIEISVTPNRADCLSIIGIARDISVLSQAKLNMPKISSIKATISDMLPIQVDIQKVCPRYLGRIIKNINIETPTPLWMKERLRRCGFHSIDAVVDVTNYVLLELGQPIHAFDRDQIEGGIVVRMAKEGETLVLINGNEVKFSADSFVIADYSKILAIGGVLGGKCSGISKKTKNVLLECAFFSPLDIMGHARRYGLYTDSSHRYEHGVDPTLQYKAMERATYLLINICGGEVGPVVDITSKSNLPKRVTIALHRRNLDRLIGYHIDDTQVSDILRRLGCEVNEDKNEWRVVPPSWRFDIKIEEDLIEEVMRVYGYNNIPDEPIQTDLKIEDYRKSVLSLRRVKNMLNDKGYQEVITYSFVNPILQQLIHPNEKALILSNPISSEMSVMRLSLWTGLLEKIIYNQNRQQRRIRIFEVGLCFVPDEQADLGIRQDLMLSGAISGNRYEEHWDLEKSIVDFYDMKGDLESILDLTGKLSEIEFRTALISSLHPGQSANLYLYGERIGSIGVLHPRLEYQLNLNSRTIVFELEWSAVENCSIPQIQEVSRFPSVRRDIAIVVAKNVPVSEILSECNKIGMNLISAKLFDVYQGKDIAVGYKSLAISLIFQNCSRSLREEEINDVLFKCIKILKDKFQISLRDSTYH